MRNYCIIVYVFSNFDSNYFILFILNIMQLEQLILLNEVELIEFLEYQNYSILDIFKIWEQVWRYKEVLEQIEFNKQKNGTIHQEVKVESDTQVM